VRTVRRQRSADVPHGCSRQRMLPIRSASWHCQRQIAGNAPTDKADAAELRLAALGQRQHPRI
jgi:hypothetical protein